MILLSTYSLVWYWLHRVFDFTKKAWYDWIDLYLTKNNYDLWDENYIKTLCDSFGIPVLSITVILRGMNEKKVDQIVKIAKKLWVQVISFSPPHFSDKNINWFNKYLLRVKRDTHLSLSILNVEPKMIFLIIPEYKNSTLWEIKKITGDTSLDLAAIDTSSGSDILRARNVLWASIKNIYLSDKRWSKSGLLPWWAWGGISYLPLESFFMKLKTSGYNGFVSLKVKPSELWVWTEEKVLQNLEYAKNYYNKHFLSFK